MDRCLIVLLTHCAVYLAVVNIAGLHTADIDNFIHKINCSRQQKIQLIQTQHKHRIQATYTKVEDRIILKKGNTIMNIWIYEYEIWIRVFYSPRGWSI